MRPSIFISRSAKRSKSFLDKVDEVCRSVVCESLIDFSLIEAHRLPEKGWLFFYSQTGIDFFLKQHSVDDIKDQGLSVGVFGPKSAEHLMDLGLTANFIGTGESSSTAAAFLKEALLSNVCFVKGSTSRDSLRPYLAPYVDTSDIEVYHNAAKTTFDIPKTDILVFTSPLNLETYCGQYPITLDQKVLTIGTSTAMSALNLGLNEVYISKEPSLESLAKLVVEVCETWGPSE